MADYIPEGATPYTPPATPQAAKPYTPSGATPAPTPAQPQQSNPIMNAVGNIYNLVKPQAWASQYEPPVEAMGSALSTLGKGITGNLHPQDVQSYNQAMSNFYNNPNTIIHPHPLGQNAPDANIMGVPMPFGINTQAAAKNLPGMVAEEAFLPVAQAVGGGAGGLLAKAGVSGVPAWLLSHLAGGGLASGLYGATRPNDTTLGQHLQRGVGDVIPGALSYTALSAAGEAAKRAPQFIADQAQYLFGKNAPVIQGANLNEAANQDVINKLMLDQTSGFTPEGVAKSAQAHVDALNDLIQNELQTKGANINVSIDDLDNTLRTQVAQDIQGFPQTDTGSVENIAGGIKQAHFNPTGSTGSDPLSKEYLRLFDKISNYQNDIPASGGTMPQGTLSQISLPDLYSAKQTIGDDLNTNGVWKRIALGTATDKDMVGISVYNTLKDSLDQQLQNNGLNSVSQMTEMQSNLIKGGLAQLKSAAGKTKDPSFYSVMRGLPFFNVLLPGIRAGETAGERGAYAAGNALAPIMQSGGADQVMQALSSLLTQSRLKPQQAQ